MSVNASLDRPLYHCSDSTGAFMTFSAFFLTKLVFVHPLYVFILFLGLQRWRRRSSQTSSHSDHFTYNMAALELSALAPNVVFFYGSFTGQLNTKVLGFLVLNAVFPGQILFHIVTCVERYLAVVHPVTYLGLRRSGGVRIRTICIGCVWLVSLGWIGVMTSYAPALPIIPFFCCLLFSWFIISLCSVAVLCVLIRPRPEEVGGDKVNESKQRAFYTVAVILAVLWLWFVGLSVCIALKQSSLFSHSVGCVLLTVGFWFSLPGSLVLPLLFLHRAGKLPGSKQTTESR